MLDVGKYYRVAKKLMAQVPHDPVRPPLSICAKEWKLGLERGVCTRVCCGFVHISPDVETTSVLIDK